MQQTLPSIKKWIKETDFYPQAGQGHLAYLSIPLRSVYYMKTLFGLHYSFWVSFIRDGYLEQFLSRDGMKHVYEYFLTHQKKNPHFIDTLEKQWQGLLVPLYRRLEHVADRKKLDVAGLVALYKDLGECGGKQWDALIFLDAFDADGADILHTILKENASQLGVLTYPSEMSYSQKEKLDLLNIAQHVCATGRKSAVLDAKSPSDLPDDVRSMLEAHQKSYYWYQNNYAHLVYLDVSFFLASLKKALQHDVVAEIQKIEQQFTGEIAKRDALIASLPEETKNLLIFFQKMAVLRDQRKATNCILCTNLRLIAEEIEHRLGLENGLLDSAFYWDIQRILIDKEHYVKELKQRAHGTAIVISEKYGFSVFTGDDVEALFALATHSFVKDVDHLTGKPACKGIVTGTVKVINKVEEFPLFNKGDILVSAMTRPEFLPLMEKAAAIVTDEGGITCHAAIVSRELGVPCIVGTEVATKVLKSGDRVEVDAERGIVKKV